MNKNDGRVDGGGVVPDKDNTGRAKAGSAKGPPEVLEVNVHEKLGIQSVGPGQIRKKNEKK